MSHKNSKSNGGFTIIEVLIVLAIAGLIMLIVFLAVPALQRNSRNTSIKNDVQNVLGGVAEYQGANNGKIPATIAGTNGTVTYSGASGSGANQTSIQVQGTTNVTTESTAPTTAPDPGNIRIVLQRKCNSTTTNSRAVAAYYSIETTNGVVLQCTDS
jgi:prepilin-type N-terminal cleavage/methylation domain-containing protein